MRPDRAEIWSGLQTPIVAQQSTAIELGLPVDKVKVHVVPSGGSFGRRLFWDPVQVAVQVSKLTGRPCKLMYHRANDIRHTRLRPPQYQKVRATVLLGQVIAFEQRIATVRLDARHGFGEIFSAVGGSLPASVQQSVGNLAYEEAFFKTMVASPYNFGVTTKLLVPVPLDMNTVSYRSVHIQPARSVEEIMVDEIAKRLNKDPLAFRLEYLRLPRAKAVLSAVAAAGNWGKTMPAGFAQGIAVHQETRSFTACLVEIDARVPTAARVTKATIAIDVGKPINPLGITAQMQGGLAESIALVLSGRAARRKRPAARRQLLAISLLADEGLSEGRADHHHAGQRRSDRRPGRGGSFCSQRCDRQCLRARHRHQAAQVSAQLPGRLRAVPARGVPEPGRRARLA